MHIFIYNNVPREIYVYLLFAVSCLYAYNADAYTHTDTPDTPDTPDTHIK